MVGALIQVVPFSTFMWLLTILTQICIISFIISLKLLQQFFPLFLQISSLEKKKKIVSSHWTPPYNFFFLSNVLDVQPGLLAIVFLLFSGVHSYFTLVAIFYHSKETVVINDLPTKSDGLFFVLKLDGSFAVITSFLFQKSSLPLSFITLFSLASLTALCSRLCFLFWFCSLIYPNFGYTLNSCNFQT